MTGEAVRARAFLDELDAASAEAARRGGASVLAWRVAGATLQASVAGGALPPRLAPGFAHLQAPATAAPDLALRAWDTGSTRVGPPSPPWSWAEAAGTRGELRYAAGSGCHFAYNQESQVLQALDRAANRAWLWVRSAHELPGWETAAPLRALLGWWLPACGAQLVHGAALAPPGADASAVLLAARGGSGKSTLAAAGLEHGWGFLGDDYVALRREAGRPRIASVYCTFKLNLEHQRRSVPGLDALRLPELQPFGADRKAVYSAWPARAAQVRAEVPLAAIVVPQIAPARAGAVRRIGRARALMALAPTSLFQLPGTGPANLQAIAQLTAGVPCFELALGPDAGANLRVLAALLQKAADAPDQAA